MTGITAQHGDCFIVPRLMQLIEVCVNKNPMKLGICCVYFYGEDGEWLLPLQLKFIAETLSGYPYTIYAAANRIAPDLHATLSATPNVRIVELPFTTERASAEHSIYLDKLIDLAYSDGCSHIATLDSDSFPIVNDWPRILLSKMNGVMRFSAVLRTENGDTALPHPCGYFMTRDFFADYKPSLLPGPEITQDPKFQSFLQGTKQRADTGIGYGYALWNSHEQWLPLLRSNLHNMHFLMAGIYGDIFFHLGSSSRRPAFFMDSQTHISLRLADRLNQAPFFWRISKFIVENYLKKNEKLYRQITTQLREDPRRLFSELSMDVNATRIPH